MNVTFTPDPKQSYLIGFFMQGNGIPVPPPLVPGWLLRGSQYIGPMPAKEWIAAKDGWGFLMDVINAGPEAFVPPPLEYQAGKQQLKTIIKSQ